MLRSIELCSSPDNRDQILLEPTSKGISSSAASQGVLHPGKAGDKHHLVAGNGRFLAAEVQIENDPCSCECGTVCSSMVYSIQDDQTVASYAMKEPPALKANVVRNTNVRLSLMYIIEDAAWPEYNIYEHSSWAGHRKSLDPTDKRPGVRVQIIKAEVRGPKTAPYVSYIMHVRTAFTVRGLSRRYSDFTALDSRLRIEHEAGVPVLPSKRLFGTLTAAFIHERRRQLQSYLDTLMSDLTLSRSEAVADFLAVHGHATEEKILSGVMEDLGPRVWDMPPGAPTEGVERVLESCQQRGDARLEARTLNCLALMHSEAARPERAIPALQEAVAKCRSALVRAMAADDARCAGQSADGDEGETEFWGEGLVCCLSNLGCVLAKAGSLSGALDRLRECAAEAGVQGDVVWQGKAVARIGLVLAAQGDVPAAIRACRAAVDMMGGLREGQRAAAAAEAAVGVMCWATGEVRAAVDAVERSLLGRRRARDALGLAESLHRLGSLFVHMGYHAHAQDHVEQALGLCGDLGDGEGELRCLLLLAAVRLAHRDPRAALAALDRAADLAALRNDPAARAHCHDAMARARTALGDTWLARVHVEEAAAIRAAAGLRSPDPAGPPDPTGPHALFVAAGAAGGPPAPPAAPILPAALASLTAAANGRGGAGGGRGAGRAASASPAESDEGPGDAGVMRAGPDPDACRAGPDDRSAASPEGAGRREPAVAAAEWEELLGEGCRTGRGRRLLSTLWPQGEEEEGCGAWDVDEDSSTPSCSEAGSDVGSRRGRLASPRTGKGASGGRGWGWGGVSVSEQVRASAFMAGDGDGDAPDGEAGAAGWARGAEWGCAGGLGIPRGPEHGPDCGRAGGSGERGGAGQDGVWGPGGAERLALRAHMRAGWPDDEPDTDGDPARSADGSRITEPDLDGGEGDEEGDDSFDLFAQGKP